LGITPTEELIQQKNCLRLLCALPTGRFGEEQTLAAELLDEFGKTLMPILNNAGVTPVKPKVHPVHNVIEG
jgi:hypothetical protein